MNQLCLALNNITASFHLSSHLIFAAAGKSTFIRLLEESSPSYRVISEPLTRWLNVPQDEEVRRGGERGGRRVEREERMRSERERIR